MSRFATQTTVHYCGLFPTSGNRDDFPLVNARVHYDLIDVQSLATLIQTYTSNASIALDVNYVCPLPSDASVCSFKAIIDGTRAIKGIVKEKAKARAEYNDAVSQGKTAALLEQSNVEIFQISLGNIHPKSTIEIHISFASVISHDGDLDSIRLTFPSAIAPKYGAAPNTQLNYMSNVRGWFHPLVRSFKSALDFSVAVQMTSHIKSITSPSHPIAMKMGESTLEPSTEFDPFKARISLSSPTLLDKDIVVVLSCQGLDKPRCTVESFSSEEGSQEYTDAYALTFVPRFELPALPSQEFIFLVDRSGSMQGGKMPAVRSALQIMLRSLPTRGTSFNLLSFGSSHSSLWPTSVTYSADSLQLASQHVDGMEANYGGTEIRSALEAAFSSRTKDVNTPTTVFILTDGEAYDLDGVQAAVTQCVSQSKGKPNFLRVFCMGIGNAVSKAMCDLVARVGRGVAVYVGEEEKPDQKLMGLLRAARGAVVEDLTVDWGVPDGSNDEKGDFDFEMVSSYSDPPATKLPPISLFDEGVKFNNDVPSGPDTAPVKLSSPPTIQQAPASKSLPPMYPGFRTSIFAIVKRTNAGNSAPSKVIRISGSVLGRQVTLEVAATPVMAPETSLQNNVKILHVLAARALVQRFEDEGKAGMMTRELKAEVLRVAERYGIASSETSFVAIDESGVTVDVVEPIIVIRTHTGGFGGGGGITMMPMMMPMMMPTPPMAPASRSRAPIQRSFSRSAAFGSSAPAPAPPSGNVFGNSGQSPFTQQSQKKSLGGGLFGQAQQQQQQQQQYQQMAQSVVAQDTSYSLQLSCENDKDREKLRLFTPLRGGGSPTTSNMAAQPQSLPSTIESFARSQSFEGSFNGSPALYQLLVKQPNPPPRPDILGSASDLGDKIWCTLLCVVYLETKLAGKKDVWGIMVEKAMSWMEDALESALGADNLTVKKEALKGYAKNCIT